MKQLNCLKKTNKNKEVVEWLLGSLLVTKMLGHQDMEFNCVLALGYANQLPKMQPRKKLEDIMDWYENGK